MKKVTRREALKSGGTLLVGGAIVGCGSEADTRGEGSESSPSQGVATELDSLYDKGAIPIAESGWTKTQGLGTHYPSLATDLVTDVLVIGAGLAGGSLALHLSELSINTVVLEARQPGWGASGRNAGHVLPLLRDMSVFEQFPDQGHAFFELFREHHTLPFDIAKRYDIDCDAVASGYLNAMTSQSAFDKFKQSSLASAEALGQNLIDVDAATMHEMTGSHYYSHGLLYESGGRINPYLFTRGMIKAAVENGVRVYGDSVATAVSPQGKGWRVQLEGGNSVSCDKLIFCTNAYATDIMPQFQRAFYPVTAYALSTTPLPAQIRDIVLPSRATLAQVPIDLNPLIVDGHNRIVTASIPSSSRPANAQWHFEQHLKWIHRTWPETRDVPIELESYWTGRVAMREREFPGMYQLDSGIYGLMHFNAWGNVMAPLMGRSLAQAIASDSADQLPFPIVKPDLIANPGKQEFLLRSLMIPAARLAQSFGFI
ncbi:FAD-dependent oxidoreductase [Pseudohalioglobus lutimaris]|uniref:FAD-dependent oxidoreductase n=1 Tax=Pseudohalioglobus lutimaris TaxID=1737061 RepID=A0A2N5WYX8_9GAMM|nr:FAD-dependent oxidoreductase [Pseudohalioglobus lutimaris]